MCGQLDGRIAIWFMILNDVNDYDLDEDDNLGDDDDVVITEEHTPIDNLLYWGRSYYSEWLTVHQVAA